MSAVDVSAIQIALHGILRQADLRLDAYLIGSMATGEFSTSQYSHSDIDIILIGSDAFTPIAISAIRRHLQIEWARYAESTNWRLGVRYRTDDQLPGFCRYLVLQGFNIEYAKLLISRNDEASQHLTATLNDLLPHELQCVTLETQWADLRMLSCKVTPLERIYYLSKVCLSYLSLFLIQKNIFKATHKSRVAALRDVITDFDLINVCQDALKNKVCGLDFIDLPLLTDYEHRLYRWRRFVLNEIRVAFNSEGGGGTESTTYWLPSTISDRDYTNRFCQELFGFFCQFNDQQLAAKVEVPGEFVSHYLLSHVPSSERIDFRSLENEGIVHLFNEARLRNSPSAFADWG